MLFVRLDIFEIGLHLLDFTLVHLSLKQWYGAYTDLQIICLTFKISLKKSRYGMNVIDWVESQLGITWTVINRFVMLSQPWMLILHCSVKNCIGILWTALFFLTPRDILELVTFIRPSWEKCLIYLLKWLRSLFGRHVRSRCYGLVNKNKVFIWFRPSNVCTRMLLYSLEPYTRATDGRVYHARRQHG